MHCGRAGDARGCGVVVGCNVQVVGHESVMCFTKIGRVPIGPLCGIWIGSIARWRRER